MRFTLEQRFPASLDAVEAALLDDAFLARMAELPKLGAPQLLDRRDEGRLVHRRIRHRFTGSLSSAVRRVIDPGRLTWVEESTTDLGTHRTEFRVVPDHYRELLRCRAVIELLADGQSTRRVTEGTVDVRVPVVGGRAERAIVSGLGEHAEAEVEVFRRWWADRPG
jgi:Protein of unknown function (DUF2505)